MKKLMIGLACAALVSAATLILNGNDQVLILDGEGVLSADEHGHFGLRVCLYNVVDIDVAPSASRRIHNLNVHHFSFQFVHVQNSLLQFLAATRPGIGAGDAAHDSAIQQQVHASLAFVSTATDEEAQISAFDLDRR